MKCPKCLFENREGVKFCEECGTEMELRCPSCGAKLALDRKFCGECGKPVESSTKAEKTGRVPEGERKQVTVLFSDLTGYSTLSERLDPEEIKEQIERKKGKRDISIFRKMFGSRNK